MASSTSPSRISLPQRLAEASLWSLLLTVWGLYDPDLVQPFRLPKQVASEALVLLSVVLLACGLWQRPELRLGDIWRWPAVRMAVPFLGVALLAFALGEHRLHGAAALRGLGIGSLALAAWSLAFSSRQLDRLLRLTVVPAMALAAVALLQLVGWVEPFDLLGEAEQARVRVTSFAGSSGDLAMFLVLPGLVAQRQLAAVEGPRRWLWLLPLALAVATLVGTQNFTALAALGAGSALFWGWLLPRRRFLLLLGGLVAMAAVLVLTVAPLRERVEAKVLDLQRGRINAFLTGRLDGWNAALWMFRQHPVLGVGPGGYQADFAEAKLALAEEGVSFLRTQEQVMFADAHNEYLEVAAELGLAGLAALGWGIFVFVSVLRRGPPAPPQPAPRRGKAAPEPQAAEPGLAAFAWAGTLALVVLALTQFPFRIALTAYPALLFLAWVLAVYRDAPPAEESA